MSAVIAQSPQTQVPTFNLPYFRSWIDGVSYRYQVTPKPQDDQQEVLWDYDHTYRISETVPETYRPIVLQILHLSLFHDYDLPEACERAGRYVPDKDLLSKVKHLMNSHEASPSEN